MKNIILDLGVVLLRLNFEGANEAFRKMNFGYENPFEVIEQKTNYLAYEKGQVSDEEFIEDICKAAENSIGKQDVLDAWNLIIDDFDDDKIEDLHWLSDHFNLFLLSNTNHLHQMEYERKFKARTGIHLPSLFNKAYYSHDIGLRKPDASIFEFVLKHHQLDPQATLFVDDLLDNVYAAEALNIHTHHYKKGERLRTVIETKL